MALSRYGNMVMASTASEDRKKPQADQVASLIAPGGIFAQEEEVMPPVRRGPKGTTYAEAFPGVLPSPEYTWPILQGRRSIRQQEATAIRTVVREPLDTWKECFQKPDIVDPTAAARELRRQRRTREEHESRWRRWMKQKQKERNPDATSFSGTMVSSIPAGLRPAKCIGDSFPDGIRLPLFGEDTPLPIWTVAGDSPWLDGKRHPAPRPPDETPWLKVNDPAHPLREMDSRFKSTSSIAQRSMRSKARSVASTTEEHENGDPQSKDSVA